MFYPSLVISILAAIVASQALITSTFQLLSQIMHSSYFPHIKMTYTGTTVHGQVYIPMVNWLMMIGTVIVTAIYNNVSSRVNTKGPRPRLTTSQTTKLGNAYGVCVILVTFITTNLVTLVALIVWRTHPVLVFIVWLPFVTLDALFLSSSLVKVPDGAWFTLLLGSILASFFSLWRYGKEKQWTAEANDSVRLADLVANYPSRTRLHLLNTHNPETTTSTTGRNTEDESALRKKLYLRLPRYSGAELAAIKGFGIFFDKAGTDAHVPQVYEHFCTKFEAQLSVVVFLHLRALGIPHVHDEDRYTVAKTALQDVYRLTIRHGYNDRVVSPHLGRLVYEELRKAIVKGTVGSRARGPAQVAAAPQPQTAILDSEAGLSTISTFEPTEEPARPASPTSAAAVGLAARRLRAVDDAYESQTLFLVGKEQLRVTEKTGFGGLLQRAALALFLFVRENTRQKVAQLDVPVDKLVEVGFVGMI